MSEFATFAQLAPLLQLVSTITVAPVPAVMVVWTTSASDLPWTTSTSVLAPVVVCVANDPDGHPLFAASTGVASKSTASIHRPIVASLSDPIGDRTPVDSASRTHGCGTARRSHPSGIGSGRT